MSRTEMLLPLFTSLNRKSCIQTQLNKFFFFSWKRLLRFPVSYWLKFDDSVLDPAYENGLLTVSPVFRLTSVSLGGWSMRLVGYYAGYALFYWTYL